MKILALLCSLQLMFIGACGTASKASPYAPLTKEEQARQALDILEYELAVTLFKEVIEGDPENYELYRLLASAYAALGGFDIIEAAKSNVAGGGSGGSLVDSLGSFLPPEPSPAQIENMGLAKETILAMPAENRSTDHPEISYASGAAIQLQFYQSAYGIMYMKQFTRVGTDGKLDPTQLDTMSEADVDTILNSFSEVAATGGEGVPTAAAAVLTQIDAQEGGSRKEKLINYLNKPKST